MIFLATFNLQLLHLYQLIVSAVEVDLFLLQLIQTYAIYLLYQGDGMIYM